MGWVKEANKLGKYEETYMGFRLYWLKDSEIKETFEERQDGLWRCTDYIPGDIIGIDKTGCRIEEHYLNTMYYKIRIELLKRYYNR